LIYKVRKTPKSQAYTPRLSQESHSRSSTSWQAWSQHVGKSKRESRKMG
jgi:hypothetical protein